MRRIALVILALLLTTAAPSPAVAAKPKPKKPPCNIKGATTTARGEDYPTSRVVVTTTRAADEDDLYDSGVRTYWGCIAGTKATKLLTTTGGAIAHIIGDYAAIAAYSYDTACTKYGAPPGDDCSRERVVIAANLKRRTITYKNTGLTADPLLVLARPDGSIAWIQGFPQSSGMPTGQTLQFLRAGATTPTEIAKGPFAFDTVRFYGGSGALEWYTLNGPFTDQNT